MRRSPGQRVEDALSQDPEDKPDIAGHWFCGTWIPTTPPETITLRHRVVLALAERLVLRVADRTLVEHADDSLRHALADIQRATT